METIRELLNNLLKFFVLVICVFVFIKFLDVLINILVLVFKTQTVQNLIDEYITNLFILLKQIKVFLILQKNIFYIFAFALLWLVLPVFLVVKISAGIGFDKIYEYIFNVKKLDFVKTKKAKCCECKCSKY